MLSQQQKTQRSRRTPYSGPVRLLVDLSPWKLALSLRGVNLSQSGVFATAEVGEKSPKFCILRKLETGVNYALQLECADSYIAAVNIVARLVRRESIGRMIGLAFSFPTPHEDLQSLVYSLNEHGS